MSLSSSLLYFIVFRSPQSDSLYLRSCFLPFCINSIFHDNRLNNGESTFKIRPPDIIICKFMTFSKNIEKPRSGNGKKVTIKGDLINSTDLYCLFLTFVNEIIPSIPVSCFFSSELYY